MDDSSGVYFTKSVSDLLPNCYARIILKGEDGAQSLSIRQLLRSGFQCVQEGGQIGQYSLYGRLLGVRAGDGQYLLRL